MEAFLFYIIAGLTALSAIATVVTQNIVRAATWLLFTLVGTSGIFFLLGADLVGAIQLMVYVGGTLVLVVFGVMLTAQGPFINMKTSSAEWAISATVGITLLVVLVVSARTLRDGTLRRPIQSDYNSAQQRDSNKRLIAAGKQPLDSDEDLIQKAIQANRLSNDVAKSPHSAVIGQGFLGVPVGPPHIERPGGARRIVRASYLLPFEIVSVHLLVVLIGAAYLARAKRRRANPELATTAVAAGNPTPTMDAPKEVAP